MRRLALALALVFILVGCGGESEAPISIASTGVTAAQTSPSPAVPQGSATVTSKAPARISTAEDVVTALRAAGLPIGNMIVYDATTDPNTLLGRPNGYTSKTAFTDTRISGTDTTDEFDISNGGSVEYFATNELAVSRSEYIQTFGKSLPSLIEYNYINGGVLLRLSKELTPEQAGAYETALKTFKI